IIGMTFIACIAAFGMLASVLSKSANVSMLITLTFWLVFVAVVPNTALFWAQTIFGIESPESISERVYQERQEINNNAPEGSWSSNGSNPFFYRHELRANNQTNLMNSEKRIRDAYYLDMFRQLKRVRLATLLSPVSLFEYMSDSIIGGGFVRFMKNWKDLHTYQERFLVFFKDKDAADPDSPHWYNPYEDYSTTRKPVNFEEVPLYTEGVISLADRFSALSFYLVIMLLYTIVIYFLSFVLFVRYDVR
ncbi:MAG: ABC transporter permease subunit, partial [Candidatus Latescibacteria bacterium]|nr:ABC transporter permease subunit [Candidatus Latescibacterota bacterium]